jgi:hypothetical protein
MVLKQTKTNQNNPKFSEKISKYAFYLTVSVSLLFVSVQSKRRNFLSFGIEAKQPKQTFCL